MRAHPRHAPNRAARHAGAARAVLAALVMTVAAGSAGAQVLRALPAPPTPAAQAPPAPNLAAAPRPPRPPILPALDLPEGLALLPGLGWRLSAPDPDAAQREGLAAIGRHLATVTGRVTLVAQAAGPADDPSVARRTALARARAAKEVLVAAGVPDTRVDIRPMGRTPEGRDALDILAPPGPPPPPPVPVAVSVVPPPPPEPAAAPARTTPNARPGPARQNPQRPAAGTATGPARPAPPRQN